MKKLALFFLGLVILTNSAYSIDCLILDNDKVSNCEYLKTINNDLVANLIYTNSFEPNFIIITDYNSKIRPIVSQTNKTYIKNAWINIVRFEPEIYSNGELLIPNQTKLYIDYNYEIKLPENKYSNNKRSYCKKLYTISKNEHTPINKISNFNVNSDGNLTKEFNINIQITEKIYNWEEVCLKDDCNYECEYSDTKYYHENLLIKDSINYNLYNLNLNTNLNKLETYHNTTKYYLTNNQNLILELDNSTLIQQNYEFNAFYKNNSILALKVVPVNSTKINNLLLTNNFVYTPSSNLCKLRTSDYFTIKEINCSQNQTNISGSNFKTHSQNKSFNLLFMLIIFFTINYIIYKILRKKLGTIFFLLFLLIPLSYATTQTEDCGIMNLGTCLPQKALDKIVEIVNAPIEPLLEQIKYFLEVSPSISVLKELWIMMIYVVSLFYGLLFIYSGFTFIFSGYDVVKRAMAKEWFYNTLVMIVLVQASYFLYDVTLELGANMTSSILSVVDPTFFKITIDNITNVGLQVFFYSGYLVILLLTLLMLSVRYLILVLGLIIVPFAILFYFIPPLKSFGKLIFNLLGMFIFSGFFAGLIILTSSKLLSIEVYASMKILVMITCFFLIDLMFLLIFWHAVTKSAVSDSGTKFIAAMKFITPQSSNSSNQFKEPYTKNSKGEI